MSKMDSLLERQEDILGRLEELVSASAADERILGTFCIEPWMAVCLMASLPCCFTFTFCRGHENTRTHTHTRRIIVFLFIDRCRPRRPGRRKLCSSFAFLTVAMPKLLKIYSIPRPVQKNGVDHASNSWYSSVLPSGCTAQDRQVLREKCDTYYKDLVVGCKGFAK